MPDDNALPPGWLTDADALEMMIDTAIAAGRDHAEQAHLAAEIARSAAAAGQGEARAAEALRHHYEAMRANREAMAIELQRDCAATPRQADALVAGTQGMFFQRAAELSASIGLAPGCA